MNCQMVLAQEALEKLYNLNNNVFNKREKKQKEKEPKNIYTDHIHIHVQIWQMRPWHLERENF